MLLKVDLASYNNAWYKPGNPIKRILWFYTNAIFFNSGLFPFYGLKRFFLKLYGASIGKNVLIKPHVNIKYPWLLTVGNNVWVGEQVWIDNLAPVSIGNNVCISQGALLLCGNHNYKKTTFDLSVNPIIIEDGVWICAKTIIVGGVTCASHTVINTGSVLLQSTEPYGIYAGNPAGIIKTRTIF
jgi:putative colanic acid biosynthesis acetyltransferase WcaF